MACISPDALDEICFECHLDYDVVVFKANLEEAPICSAQSP